MNFNIFLIVLICATTNSEEGEKNSKDEYDKFVQNSRLQGVALFSSLENVRRYFRENDTSPLAKLIIDTFERDCMYMEEPELPPNDRRKPFIVIDGNHRPSREVVGMRLSKLMSGRFLIHPAPCLARFLDVLPKGSLLRRGYYMLSVYAQAFNVKVHLNLGRAVIINGYWLDQLSFHIIQSFPHGPFPPVSSDIFKFPDDLLQPDVIYYLDIPDHLSKFKMTTRSPLIWKPRALELYTNLASRYPIVKQKLTGYYRTTTNDIYQHIQETLSGTRVIWPFKHNIEFDYQDTEGSQPHYSNATMRQ